MSNAREIDRICDEFEAARQAGDEPSIADYANRMPEEMRAELLAALIPLDVTYCRKRPEPLDVQDYSVFGPDAGCRRDCAAGDRTANRSSKTGHGCRFG